MPKFKAKENAIAIIPARNTDGIKPVKNEKKIKNVPKISREITFFTLNLFKKKAIKEISIFICKPETAKRWLVPVSENKSLVSSVTNCLSAVIIA